MTGQPPEDSPAKTGQRAGWRRLRLRPETTLLVFAALWTLGAKFAAVRSLSASSVAADMARAGLSDLVFFFAVAVLFSVGYFWAPRRLVAHVTLVVSAIVLAWSLLNAAWLIATGVQLQPSVLRVLGRDLAEFWPVVKTHLAHNLAYAIPILATVAGGGGWIVWRLVRPVPTLSDRRHHACRAAVLAALLAAACLGHMITSGGAQTAYASAVIGFSSHWHALTHVLSAATDRQDVTSTRRILARVGEREIGLPQSDRQPLPNVVIILLESVSRNATMLGDPQKSTTPNLARLAAEGVEFVSTRTPAAQTGKAFWAVLTGSTPEIAPGYAEAVLADTAYASLASLLARAGFRSAFFEMSKGSFQCAPGLFANLAFDWAWFRENLEDPTTHLGYFNGDDFSMIEPMFQWVDAGEQPFLLTLITSVSHDPYVLPDWYEHELGQTRYEQYLQAIRFTDAFVGKVLAQLEMRGLSDNTLLCVIGDHGEGFRPESRRIRWSPFDEVIRVPWVIRWPGRVQAGSRINGPCSQLDVTPTILRLIGFQINAAGFDGKDALGPLPSDRRFYFSTPYRDSPLGYVQEDRKLVYWPYTDKLYEFDLAADPGEESPLVIDGPEKDAVIADIVRWKRDSRFVIPARRFRERLLYEHWQAFSSGRSAWAYYVQ